MAGARIRWSGWKRWWLKIQIALHLEESSNLNSRVDNTKSPSRLANVQVINMDKEKYRSVKQESVVRLVSHDGRLEARIFQSRNRCLIRLRSPEFYHEPNWFGVQFGDGSIRAFNAWRRFSAVQQSPGSAAMGSKHLPRGDYHPWTCPETDVNGTE